MNNLKTNIINYIKEFDKTCGEFNHGVDSYSLADNLEVTHEEITNALNELFVEKKITVKDSTSGKLIFYKY